MRLPARLVLKHNSCGVELFPDGVSASEVFALLGSVALDDKCINIKLRRTGIGNALHKRRGDFLKKAERRAQDRKSTRINSSH